MSIPNDAPWSAPEEPPRRDIADIELVEKQAPGAENEIARAVAEAVGRVVEELTQAELDEVAADKVTRFRSLVMKATETAVGAVEGTLRAKSLEGALREAQIVETYASVREHNANAARSEAETAEIHQRMVFERIKETVALYRDLGLDIQLVALPDGRLGIAVGDHLAEVLPALPSARSAGELA